MKQNYESYVPHSSTNHFQPSQLPIQLIQDSSVSLLTVDELGGGGDVVDVSGVGTANGCGWCLVAEPRENVLMVPPTCWLPACLCTCCLLSASFSLAWLTTCVKRQPCIHAIVIATLATYS